MEFPTAGKPIRCKAAIGLASNQPLVVDTVEVAVPKSLEVRVKVLASGVCHSDLLFSEEGRPSCKFPFPCVFGHEGAGIVESIGDKVTYVKPGDHVILLSIPQCRKCDQCKHPGTNVCEIYEKYHAHGVMCDNTTRVTHEGKNVYQFNGIGTFAEYTVTTEVAVVKVNPKAPMDKICLLGCCVSTGFGSAINVANVQPGSSCAIWGLGGVGMSVVMGCTFRNAKRIIGIDINPDKFELAKKMGCTECFNPNDYQEPIEDVLTKMINGGLDYTFVSVGNVTAMKSGLRAANKYWGVAVLIGVGENNVIDVDAWDLLEGRTWKGALIGRVNMQDDLPGMVEMHLEGKLMLDELVTNIMPIEKINEAFAMMKQEKGKLIRTVIKF